MLLVDSITSEINKTQKKALVKICGITTESTLSAVIDSGANAVGLMFYEPSPRYVDTIVAKRLSEQCEGILTRVGVFVNPSTDLLNDVLSIVNIDLLQFHGQETEEFCKSWGRPYIKAVTLNPNIDISKLEKKWSSAVAFLFDSKHTNLLGGTGKVFDWSLVPESIKKPFILAGGLNIDNVKQAIKEVDPWCLDISSGVESARGIKDSIMIKEFMAVVNS